MSGTENHENGWANIRIPVRAEKGCRGLLSWDDLLRPASQCKTQAHRNRVDKFIRDLLSEDTTAHWVRKIMRDVTFSHKEPTYRECRLYNDESHSLYRCNKVRTVRLLMKYGFLDEAAPYKNTRGKVEGTLVKVSLKGPVACVEDATVGKYYRQVAKLWAPFFDPLDCWRLALGIAIRAERCSTLAENTFASAADNKLGTLWATRLGMKDTNWHPGITRRQAHRLVEELCDVGYMRQVTVKAKGQGRDYKMYAVNALNGGSGILFRVDETAAPMYQNSSAEESKLQHENAETAAPMAQNSSGKWPLIINDLPVFSDDGWSNSSELTSQIGLKRGTHLPSEVHTNSQKAADQGILHKNCEGENGGQGNRVMEEKKDKGASRPELFSANAATGNLESVEGPGCVVEDATEREARESGSEYIATRQHSDPVELIEALLLQGDPRRPKPHSVLLKFPTVARRAWGELFAALLYGDPQTMDPAQLRRRAVGFVLNWMAPLGLNKRPGPPEQCTMIERVLDLNTPWFTPRPHPIALLNWLADLPPIPMPALIDRPYMQVSAEEPEVCLQPLEWLFVSARLTIHEGRRSLNDTKELESAGFSARASKGNFPFDPDWLIQKMLLSAAGQFRPMSQCEATGLTLEQRQTAEDYYERLLNPCWKLDETEIRQGLVRYLPSRYLQDYVDTFDEAPPPEMSNAEILTKMRTAYREHLEFPLRFDPFPKVCEKLFILVKCSTDVSEASAIKILWPLPEEERIKYYLLFARSLPNILRWRKMWEAEEKAAMGLPDAVQPPSMPRVAVPVPPPLSTSPGKVEVKPPQVSLTQRKSLYPKELTERECGTMIGTIEKRFDHTG
jgi:hypothetical protein